MGRWMCQHLMTQGLLGDGLQPQPRTRPSRSSSRGATLRRHARRRSPSKSDVVFAIVGFPKDVREVFLGPDGALAGSKPGTILVDMTTSEPSLAQEIYEAAKAKGVHARRCPGVAAATSGRRTRRCRSWSAATQDAVAAVKPLFECMGKTIVHQGAAGAGPAHEDGQPDPDRDNMIGVCEALLYGYKAGLDLETVLNRSAAGRRGAVAGQPGPAHHRRAISSRASSSSTSSRTWASRWPRPRR